MWLLTTVQIRSGAAKLRRLWRAMASGCNTACLSAISLRVTMPNCGGGFASGLTRRRIRFGFIPYRVKCWPRWRFGAGGPCLRRRDRSFCNAMYRKSTTWGDRLEPAFCRGGCGSFVGQGFWGFSTDEMFGFCPGLRGVVDLATCNPYAARVSLGGRPHSLGHPLDWKLPNRIDSRDRPPRAPLAGAPT